MKEIKNPLAGQEVKVQAGIDRLNELKKKYKSIPDSRYLPKHIPNEMRGKPFKDRLIPGIYFQTYGGTKIGFDISPYAMYRVSGRLRSGISISDRFLIDNKKFGISSGHIYSIRIMTDFRMLSQFYFHMEEEWSYYDKGAQDPNQNPSAPSITIWRNKLNMGALRTFRISRRLDGQMQLLYNALDLSNFPQGKNVATRFGLEYKLGIKKKSNSK